MEYPEIKLKLEVFYCTEGVDPNYLQPDMFRSRLFSTVGIIAIIDVSDNEFCFDSIILLDGDIWVYCLHDIEHIEIWLEKAKRGIRDFL